MNTFDGFKEAELEENGTTEVKRSIQPVTGKTMRKKKTIKPMKDLEVLPIPDGAKLSVQKTPDLESSPDVIKNINSEFLNVKDSEPSAELKPDEDITDSSSEMDREKKLEIMKERRKVIERENKKKRQILSETIAQRKQETLNEAEKLKTVQAELASIENELNSDVRFLMDAIQTASIEFSNAQKRYDHIEKEFVNAKVDLQVKKERKDMLMEHLLTIIEQNELRKADKLEKIMKELGVR